jgi:hypothetical protein
MSQTSADEAALFERQMQKRRHVVDLLLAPQPQLVAAQSTTLMHFLEHYSVHDSSWIGVWIDPLAEQAILAFEWDAFWTEGRVPYPSNQVAYWPTLLIRLSKLALYYYDKHDQFEYGSNHIDGAETRSVTSEEREQLLASFSGNLKLTSSGTDFLFAEDLVFTTLTGDMGKWHFLHSNHVDVLCLTEDGQPIPIPGV